MALEKDTRKDYEQKLTMKLEEYEQLYTEHDEEVLSQHVANDILLIGLGSIS